MSDPLSTVQPPLPLGTKTPWGEVGAVMWTGGERYYHLINKRGTVSMIPGYMVEESVTARKLSGEGK